MSASAVFERLLDALLPGGGAAVPLVEAYFDESGSHDDSPVLCVAGYIMEAEEAKRFGSEWRAVLEPHGLSAFHMVDCAHGNEEFADIPKPTRIEIATQCIALVNRYAWAGLGASISAAEYAELMPEHPNLGGAYNFLLWNCLFGVRHWLDVTKWEHDVAYFFEAGHKHQGEANRIMDLAFRDPAARAQLHHAGHAFVDKKKSPAIQAADLFAWQLATDHKRRMRDLGRRKDFEALLASPFHKAIHIDADRILETVEIMRAQGAWDMLT
jgi:hypothetical protein